MSVHFMSLTKLHRFEALVLRSVLAAAAVGTREDDWLSGFTEEEKERAIHSADRLLDMVNKGIAGAWPTWEPIP